MVITTVKSESGLYIVLDTIHGNTDTLVLGQQRYQIETAEMTMIYVTGCRQREGKRNLQRAEKRLRGSYEQLISTIKVWIENTITRFIYR